MDVWLPFTSENPEPTCTTPRRKARRSWFTPSKDDTLAKRQARRKSGSPKSDYEVLTLTHFTKQPRIDFGKVKQDKTRTRQLMVCNPHDYEQEVTIEKFPFKKNFDIEKKTFVVPAKGEEILEITWMPKDVGNCREMVQFHVDGVYRLTAILFGNVPAPPAPKRKRKAWTAKLIQPLGSLSKSLSNSPALKPRTPESKVKVKSAMQDANEIDSDSENQIPDQPSAPKSPDKKIVMKKFTSPVCPKKSPSQEKVETSLDSEISNTPLPFCDVTHTVTANTRTPSSMRRSLTFTKLNELKDTDLETPKMAAKLDLDDSLECDVNVAVTSLEKENKSSEVDVHKAVTTTPLYMDTPTRQYLKIKKINDDTPSKQFLSPDSFLKTPRKDQLSPDEVHSYAKIVNGKFAASPEPFTPLETQPKTPAFGCQVTPDSFLMNAKTPVHHKKEFDANRDIPSPSALLDDSIPHDVLVQQLEHVKSELKHRLSSTPLYPYPRRVSSETVTKSGPASHDEDVVPDGSFLENKQNTNKAKVSKPTVTKARKSVGKGRKSDKLKKKDLFSLEGSKKKSTTNKATAGKVPLPKKFAEIPDSLGQSPRRTTWVVKKAQGTNQKTPSKILFSKKDPKPLPEEYGQSPRRTTWTVAKKAEAQQKNNKTRSPSAKSPLAKEVTSSVHEHPKPSLFKITPTKSREDSTCELTEVTELDEVFVSKPEPSVFVVSPRKTDDSSISVKDDSSKHPKCEVVPTTFIVTPTKMGETDVPQSHSDSEATQSESEQKAAADSKIKEIVFVTKVKEVSCVAKEKIKQVKQKSTVTDKTGHTLQDSEKGKLKFHEEVLKEALQDSVSIKDNEIKQEEIVENAQTTKGTDTKEESSIDFPVHDSVVTSAVLHKKRSHSKTSVGSDSDKPEKPEQSQKKMKVKAADGMAKTAPRPNMLSTERKPTRTEQLRRAAATNSKPKPKPSSKTRGPGKGLAPNKLTLLNTKVKTAIPKHPLPFAAKNMYYDERWMEKQDKGFVRWLNFILTPQDEGVDAKKTKTKVDVGALCVDTSKTDTKLAPSKETLSFRAYSARRRLNRLRRSACLLFQSEPVVQVVQKIEAEIESGRLLVRKDRKIRADLGIKQKILDMILSYNPLWLRIGLETTYGEVLPIQSNNDVIGLSRFVLTRLLGNPDIAAEYSHPTVPHLFREGYDEALAVYTLKKFIILVFFLDRAKLTRLIDHDPCLFCKDADFKASKDLLLQFSRDYLSGEGDITRHLGYLGCNVTHIQTALDEYDFAVTKLAVDLRDGIRLTRVIELLTQNWSLSKNLRCPAISRLQKIHNVEVAMKELTERGLDVTSPQGGNINSRDVVDGHREKTLALLWRVIFNFQVDMILNLNQLKEEVQFLTKDLKIRSQLTAALQTDTLGLSRAGRRESTEPDLYFKSERLSFLLKWCKAVCAYYDLKIENFTVSFSDGRALCYLVHHYHPGLLPLDGIKTMTTQSYHGDTDENDTDGDDSFHGTWSMTFSPTSGKSAFFDELLSNERENFKILYDKVSELGGIPVMVRSTEMSNTIPDEKVVITYVSYLCARLLDIRIETRAARIIQVAWRKYRLKDQLEKQKIAQEQYNLRCTSAVMVLQKHFRGCADRRKFLLQRSAAIKIQAFLRGYRVRKTFQAQKQAALTIQSKYRARLQGRIQREVFRRAKSAVLVLQKFTRQWRKMRIAKQHNAARCIQGNYRIYKAKKELSRRKNAAVVLQNAVKSYLAVKKFNNLKHATRIIQNHWRAALSGRRQRSDYQKMKQGIVLTQALYRGRKARSLVKQIKSAITIQAAVRCFLARKAYCKSKSAAIVIQAVFRCKKTQRRYQSIRRAMVTIQQRWRAVVMKRKAVEEYQSKRGAVIKLQSLYRGMVCHREYTKLKNAIIKAQSIWRQKTKTKEYAQMKSAALVIQSHYRAYRLGQEQHRKYNIMLGAAITIQAYWRGHIVSKQYIALCHYTVLIQSCIRMYQARKAFREMKTATISMQKRYRAKLNGRRQQQHYQCQRNSCIKIQSAFRGWQERKTYRQIQNAVVCIQKHTRRFLVQKEIEQQQQAARIVQMHYRAYRLGQEKCRQYRTMRKAAITLQANWRSLIARKNYVCVRDSAVLIQSYIRMYQARESFKKQKAAVLVLQRRYKAKMVAREQHYLYQEQRKTIILVQSTVRRWIAERQYSTMRNAVIVLQKHTRRYQTQKHLEQMHSAAAVIQTRYRAWKLTQDQHRQYNLLLGATITIQAYWRSYVLCRYYQSVRKAAVVIQSYVRMVQARREYRLQKAAAVILQKRFRAKMATRYQYIFYHIQRGACIQIQSAVRGWFARKQYIKIRKAVVCLQKYTRGFLARNQYARSRKATITLQRYAKATLMARVERRNYLMKKRAAVILQAAYRGHMVRKQVEQMENAVICLQKYTRGYLARKQYAKTRKVVITLQRYAKATLMAKMARKQYLIKKGATIILQAAFRGMYDRRRVRQIRSAIIIQSNIRRYLAMQNFKKMRQACVLLQANLKACQARQRYIRMKKAAIVLQRQYRAQKMCREEQIAYCIKKGACITIQAAVRGFLLRRTIRKFNRAAVVIQSHFRMCHEMMKYRCLRSATQTCQKHFRAKQLRTRQRKAYLELKNAAVLIQAAFKGYQARKRVKSQHKAAAVIQAQFRQYKACKKFIEIKRAVVVLQRHFRNFAIAKTKREEYINIRKAVVKVQSMYRGHMARTQFATQRKSVIKIQSLTREYLARRSFMKTKMAAIVIQRKWKATCLARAVCRDFNIKLGAAITIQAFVKGYRQRVRYMRMKDAAVKLQACVRGHIERQKYLRLRKAVQVIQKRYRALVLGKQQRSTFKSTVSSIVKIQAAFRGYKARLEVKMEHAARCIQSVYRMYQQRKKYLHIRNTVTKLQACVRTKIVRREYQRKLITVQCLQTHFKAHLIGRKTRREFCVKLGAAITIQAWVKGFLVRRWMQKMRATRTLQTHYRVYRERRRYQRVRTAVIVLQKHARRVFAQRHLQQLKLEWCAAFCIQTYYRQYVWRRKVEAYKQFRAQQLATFTTTAREHLSAIKIQRWYRNKKAMELAKQKLQSVITIQRWMRAKLVRLHFLKLRRGVTKLQAIVRQRLAWKNEAAVRLQSVVRGWMARKFAHKWHMCIVHIQAAWRGRKVRHQIKDKKVAMARRRVQQATKAATEEKKLCNRTTSALDYLLQFKQLSYILEALIHLDVATRLSARCCERMVEGNAVSVIYTLIRSCNRSMPHMEIIKYCVSILLNLAKYDKTVHAVYDVEESVETLIELMQIYREKGSNIFCRVCMLLGILCEDKTRKEEILGIAKFPERIKSFHALTVRKSKMEEKRLTTKSKMAATKNYSGSITSGSVVKQHKIKPDWVLRKDKLRDFEDSLQAVNYVMAALDLTAK